MSKPLGILVSFAGLPPFNQSLHSLDMDIVLVFLLILVLSGGQSEDHNSSRCYSNCPAGYHKTGNCKAPADYHTCQKCKDKEYTEIENTRTSCIRCSICSHNEVEIKPCNSTSNVECECKDGFFNDGKNSDRSCSSCGCKFCKEPHKNPDYMKKCKPCQREACLSDPECKMECAKSPSTTPSTITQTTSNHTTVPPTPPTTPRNRTLSPVEKPVEPEPVPYMLWLFLWVVFVITVVLCQMLLLHLIKRKTGKPNKFLCWRTNKGVELQAEDAKSKEQESHQGSSLATLTFNISEESPMMDLSPCPVLSQRPAAHICPLLPNVEQEAVRRDKHSEHWPAIVLYAIIKEVPLRRWKEFLRLLSVADQQLERVELEAGLGSIEKQYQILRLWSQRSSAGLSDVFSALHYMDLSGCAQLLQENLEKLQWTPEPKYGSTA
nr:PREDICTED: tumor necrosis factor receptor superfamily member 1A-like isoform X1 [Paralichthys olivaceus]